MSRAQCQREKDSRSHALASQLTGPRNGAGWNCSWRNESVSFLRKTFLWASLEWGQQEVRWRSVRGLAAFVYGRGGMNWSYFWRPWFHFEIFLAHPICNNFMMCLGWHWLSTGCSLEPCEKRNSDWRIAWISLTYDNACGVLSCLLLDVRGPSPLWTAPVLSQKVLAI